MKCKECKTGRAVILFISVLCNNRSCKNYDKKWAKEVEEEEEDLLALDLSLLGNDCYATTVGSDSIVTYTTGNGSNSYSFDWTNVAVQP